MIGSYIASYIPSLLFHIAIAIKEPANKWANTITWPAKTT